MNQIEEFAFSLYQISGGLICLFFLYFAWKDIHAKTFDYLRKVNVAIVVPSILVTAVGLFFYLNHYWGNFGLFLTIEFTVLIILSIYDTKYAVSFFIYILISRPWEYFNNDLMLSMPRDIFYLVIASFIGHKLIRKRFYFQWNAASASLVFFGLWMFFSVVVSPHFSWGMKQFQEIFIKGLAVYILIVNVIDKKDYIYPIQIAMIMGIFEKAAVGVYKIYFVTEGAVTTRLTSVGILENSNDIAAILILAIPFTILFFRGLRNKYVITSIGTLIFIFYGILIWKAQSRGALLGLGSLVACWYWLKDVNKKRSFIILVLMGVITFGFMNIIKRNASDLEGSSSNRKIYWKSGINMAVRNPLFGVGYAGFNLHFPAYAMGDIGSEGKNRTIHSNWLLPLAEGGFPAFISYMLLWLLALRSAYRIRHDHPEYLLAIISYGTTITFLSHTYLLYPYILLGLTVATEQFYKVKNTQAEISADNVPKVTA